MTAGLIAGRVWRDPVARRTKTGALYAMATMLIAGGAGDGPGER
jgi:hypothetical protein